jgi:putative Mn2+ efflux pump MntP
VALSVVVVARVVVVGALAVRAAWAERAAVATATDSLEAKLVGWEALAVTVGATVVGATVAVRVEERVERASTVGERATVASWVVAMVGVETVAWRAAKEELEARMG